MIVTWEQPWYQKTGWLTRKVELNEEDKHKEKFRIDKFTLTECERVHKNWLKFVKVSSQFQIFFWNFYNSHCYGTYVFFDLTYIRYLIPRTTN